MPKKPLQYLMGHSDISVTMNTYTHLGLEDAKNELRRLSEINSDSARAELDRLNGTGFSIESSVKFG
ncbi:MAG: integrase [Lachnospiraceae bacterium]|nr:integrase [Lachnospiraceae bacterium]